MAVYKSLKILISEDDLLFSIGLEASLSPRGQICKASSAEQAFELMAKGPFDLAFIDMDYLGVLRGPEIIERARDNGIYPVVLSGNDAPEAIALAYQKGAKDYLPKLNYGQHLDRVFQQYEQSFEMSGLQGLCDSLYLTRNSKTIQELSLIPLLKGNKKSVFITGATGVGKSLVANIIHSYEGLPQEKFIALNCSALSPQLLDSELFGHEKGAFTGAQAMHRGKLEIADGGTLFLDEMGTMPAELQVKLLKALEEKVFYRVGGTRPVRSQFRIICASWENLLEMVQRGQFRPDLYFRLSGLTIHLPSLKERQEDLWPLVKFFMNQEGRMLAFSPDVRSAMENYAWPGNIRELKKLIETLALTKRGIVEFSDLPSQIRGEGPMSKEQDLSLGSGHIRFIEKYGLPHFFEEVEKVMVGRMEKKHQGKVRAILKELKISSTTYYRIAKNNLSRGAVAHV